MHVDHELILANCQRERQQLERERQEKEFQQQVEGFIVVCARGVCMRV